jgi:hypothetical protein
MYHKIIGGKKKKNQSNVKKSIEYLLRLNKEEEEQKHVRVLSNTTEQDIINYNDFVVDKEKSNPYVCGVLSFEEENISEELKTKIITEFEELLFKGIEEENRPPVLWVEHTDKGRLELNYLTFNSLQDRRSYTVYLDKRDRKLVNTYSDIINYENNLSSPFEEKPDHNNLVNKPQTDLPREKKDLIEHLNNSFISLIATEEIENREDLIKHIENLDHIKVNRVRKNQISIKCDLFEDDKPIVLKGDIYEENRDYSDYKREYKATTVRNPERVRSKLEELNEQYTKSISSRESRNRQRYKKTQAKNDRKNENIIQSKNINFERELNDDINFLNGVNSKPSSIDDNFYNKEVVNNEHNITEHKEKTATEERAKFDIGRKLEEINQQQQQVFKRIERTGNEINIVAERQRNTREGIELATTEEHKARRAFNEAFTSIKKFIKPARIFAKYRQHKFFKTFLKTRHEKQPQRDNRRRYKPT